MVYTARCNSSAKKVVIIDNLSLPSHPAVNPELAAGSFYGAKEESLCCPILFLDRTTLDLGQVRDWKEEVQHGGRHT